MRAIARLGLAALLLAGCADDDLARGLRYVEDEGYRERALEESLVAPERGYGELRLASYATWSALDAWNPPVRAVTRDDVGRFARDPERPSSPEEGALAPLIEGEVEWTEEALLALGRRAFETYPVQLAPTVGGATDDLALVERYGLWIDDRDRVGGLVRVAVADGSERFAVTCATCHARVEAGRLVHGATNDDFDWGGLSYREQLERGRDPESIAHLAAWGAGNVDVTPDAMDNPAAIPDLRSVGHPTYLHWAGTVRNELVALALRLETLLITSMHGAVRPPREIPFALALYLRRMSEEGRAGDAAAHPRGARLFEVRCASCHGADGSTPGGRMPIDEVGTDPRVGESLTRGTGYYRVPSLWRVAERRRLLHDGRVRSLEALLERERLAEVPGHEYGLDLDEADRDALVAFVRSIGAP